MSALAIANCQPTCIGNPIASIPEDRKDGRDVLLWAGYPIVAVWCDGWCDTLVGQPVIGATHWADVGGPGV